MIDDPIEIDGDGCLTRNEFFDKNTGFDMFVVRYRHPKYLGFLIQDEKKRCTVHFAVTRHTFDYCVFDGIRVAREQFLESLLKIYPDHFEWLLFHPEWL